MDRVRSRDLLDIVQIVGPYIWRLKRHLANRLAINFFNIRGNRSGKKITYFLSDSHSIILYTHYITCKEKDDVVSVFYKLMSPPDLSISR